MHLQLPANGAISALGDVPRTLLIPLAARAQGAALVPALDPQDHCAADVLARSGVQVQDIGGDMATVVNILWRTRLIKQSAQAFFSRHPQASGINLGAGLAQYFQWLDNGLNHWFDADLPDVLALRRRWLHPQGRKARQDQRWGELALDLREPHGLQTLRNALQSGSGPWLLVLEGVLMYLQPVQVRAVLRALAEVAPEGSELLCDFISPLGIGQAGLTPSLDCTGAQFHWGAHNGHEIAAFHPRLELLAQHSVAEAYGWGASLLDFCSQSWTGGPLYAMAHLRVGEPD